MRVHVQWHVRRCHRAESDPIHRSGSYNVPIYVGDILNRYLNELTTDADLGVSLAL
jgi:hypothetical protein